MSNTLRDRRGNVKSDLPYADPAEADQPDLHPGARAKCSDCDETLIAKCGEINRWHWAHEQTTSQCVGTDGEGAWHRAWKAWAWRQGARLEVTEGQHRADIMWPDGTVHELQSSYLNAVDIDRREQHWGDRLTWVYRITPGRFNRLSNTGDGWFKWNRPAASMTRHQRPIVWHVNDRLYNTTVASVHGEVRIRFAPGERDKYGPVLYGSTPAPFNLNHSIEALRTLHHPDMNGIAS